MTEERRASERPGDRTAALPAGRATDRGASVGHYLAGQRRLRGISLDELAAITKIPRRNLERLESGALEAAPDGFARGFVRTIALALGLDPDEAVMRLMTEPDSDDAEPVDAAARRRRLAQVGLALVAVALLFGLVQLVVQLWPEDVPEEPVALRYRSDAVRRLADDTPPAPDRPVPTAPPGASAVPEGTAATPSAP